MAGSKADSTYPAVGVGIGILTKTTMRIVMMKRMSGEVQVEFADEF